MLISDVFKAKVRFGASIVKGFGSSGRNVTVPANGLANGSV